MSGQYDDIINLPHHVSATRPRMSSADRAAQFSPFAALTGFGAVISETGRLTDTRIELDEYEIAELNDKLGKIREKAGSRPAASITYFIPDGRKDGGAYLTVSGAVKRIDEYTRTVVMESGDRVSIDDIAAIELL